MHAPRATAAGRVVRVVYSARGPNPAPIPGTAWSTALSNDAPTPAEGSKLPAAVRKLKLDTTGGPITLADRGGRRLVLYFYPKDSTPGCTTEGLDFAARHDRFDAAGVDVLGVSRDSIRSHENFRSKQAFPFHLVSDPDEALCEAFGVMKMKNMYGKQVRGVERSTFLIDADGRVLKAWRGVKVPGHVDAVLAAGEQE